MHLLTFAKISRVNDSAQKLGKHNVLMENKVKIYGEDPTFMVGAVKIYFAFIDDENMPFSIRSHRKR
jgi:hypothetical protein